MSEPDTSKRGLNILCIDNGGARGLSALFLIDDVMKRVQVVEGLASRPEPHQYFDLIAGTGTGAIQACMLGSLSMPIHSAIEAYTKLSKNVFSEKKQTGPGLFRMTKLRDSLRTIIQSATGDPDKLMLENQSDGRCRTLVFATSRHDVNTSALASFRSYSVAGDNRPDYTIWEVLCATMAHQGLFGGYMISGSTQKQMFLDAGQGCNNPIIQVLTEAKTLYPTHFVSSILNIGAGHSSTIQIPDVAKLPAGRFLPVAAIATMQDIATDCEKVAEDMNKRFSTTSGIYFRLNVDQGVQNMGMDSWERPGEIAAHTGAYTTSPRIRQTIDQAAQAIQAKKLSLSTTQIGDITSIETTSETGHESPTVASGPGKLGPEESSTAGPSTHGGSDGWRGDPSKDRKGGGAPDRDPTDISQQPTKGEAVLQKAKGKQGLNILCIDGGGARGLSSLLLLQEAMNRLQALEGRKLHEGSPKPSEWFDVIAGTGTGGVIACMLGKLEMSISEAIQSYVGLTEAVLSNNKWIGDKKNRSKLLKDFLRSMVKDATGNANRKMMENESELGGPKTMVFAMLRHHMNGSLPVIFRSYASSADRAPDCTIWEALYATMAHPDFFDCIDITEHLVVYSFVGGELGSSNPLDHVLKEVGKLHPGQHVSCIMSIGAGNAHTIRISSSSHQQASIAMRDMAIDSQRVAEEMTWRFQDTTRVYFRFNVDQGIQDIEANDWEKLNSVNAHAQAYMKRFEVSRSMGWAVQAAHGRKAALAVHYIDGRAHRTMEPPIIKRCPIPTPYYTGRAKEIKDISACIASDADQQQVCVIYGLGGSGKSQLAFKVIEKNHRRWDHILYVDAASSEMIESTLRDFARSKQLGATYESTLYWMQGTSDNWLLILDGADDPDLDIRPYIPSCYRGSVLITTRLPNRARLARPPASAYQIKTMDPKEASNLLLRVAHSGTSSEYETDTEEEDAAALVLDFGYLALAIVQAGAYIAHSSGMTISDYHDQFREKRRVMLEAYQTLPKASKFDDYNATVYTTWEMCRELWRRHGKPAAQELLWLIAFLHHSGITRVMFQRAAINLRGYTPALRQTEKEQEAHAYLHRYLIGSGSSVGKQWAESSFIEAISELAGYSLIEFDRRNMAYSVHVLVQDWARTIIPHNHDTALERTTSLLAVSIDTKDDLNSRHHIIGLELHVKQILLDSEKLLQEISANHLACFANVFKAMGRWEDEESLRLKVRDARLEELGPEDPATLQCMVDLAHNYKNQGKLDIAEGMYTEVLEIRNRIHGEEHDDTLASKKHLASLYQARDRFGEAETLWLEIIEACEIMKGGYSLETLSCLGNLADVYCGLKKLKEAEKLREDILKRLPDDHQDRIICIQKLAKALELQRKWDAAEAQLIRYTEALNILRGESHSNALLGRQQLYEFRLRKFSVPPDHMQCASCKLPAEVIRLCPHSKYICGLLKWGLWSLLLSLAVLAIAYLPPMFFEPSKNLGKIEEL